MERITLEMNHAVSEEEVLRVVDELKGEWEEAAASFNVRAPFFFDRWGRQPTVFTDVITFNFTFLVDGSDLVRGEPLFPLTLEIMSNSRLKETHIGVKASPLQDLYVNLTARRKTKAGVKDYVHEKGALLIREMESRLSK